MSDYKPRSRDEAWKRLIEAHAWAAYIVGHAEWCGCFSEKHDYKRFLWSAAVHAGLTFNNYDREPLQLFRDGVCVAQWSVSGDL